MAKITALDALKKARYVMKETHELLVAGGYGDRRSLNADDKGAMGLIALGSLLEVNVAIADSVIADAEEPQSTDKADKAAAPA